MSSLINKKTGKSSNKLPATPPHFPLKVSKPGAYVKKGKWVHHVDSFCTMAENIVVLFFTKPNANEAAFIKPFIHSIIK